jgi:gliding motility-associated-like protein
LPGDPVLQIATTTTITIPKILTTTNNSRCGAGNVTLSATSVSGNVAWFAQASGGNPIFTGNLFETPILNNTTAYFVQDAATLGCNNISRSLVTATIINLPTIPPIPPITICEGTVAFLTPDYDFGNLRWFESMNSTTAVFEGNSFETPPIFEDTIYYVEAVNNNCVSDRVPYQIFINPIPVVVDETVFICSNGTITLNSGISGNDYLWSNNEITENIVVTEAGIYSVTISNSFPCSATKTFEVIEIETPIIENILISQTQAIIQLENEGNFIYSLDGVNFSQNNVFNLTSGGLYTAYVRGQENDCGDTTQDFVFISIPSFFTPNNDGANDFWLVRGVENFRNYSINIYDRFGKLLHSMSRGSIGWDGLSNGNKMPSTDYWYVIQIPETNQIIKGNFSLIR